MKIIKKVVLKKILDNDVLIDLNNSKTILKLNETSAYIFKLISEEYSLEEIINNVTNEYDVDLYNASKDVNDFINELEKLKIIKQ